MRVAKCPRPKATSASPLGDAPKTAATTTTHPHLVQVTFHNCVSSSDKAPPALSCDACILIELDVGGAPVACANFMAGCQEGLAGSTIIRIADTNEHVEFGSSATSSFLPPACGFFADELSAAAGSWLQAPGALAMCSMGSNLNASKFLITLLPQPQLAGKIVVFGRVVRGLDSLQTLCHAARRRPKSNGIPMDRIVVSSCGPPVSTQREGGVAPDPAENDARRVKQRRGGGDGDRRRARDDDGGVTVGTAFPESEADDDRPLRQRRRLDSATSAPVAPHILAQWEGTAPVNPLTRFHMTESAAWSASCASTVPSSSQGAVRWDSGTVGESATPPVFDLLKAQASLFEADVAGMKGHSLGRPRRSSASRASRSRRY